MSRWYNVRAGSGRYDLPARDTSQLRTQLGNGPVVGTVFGYRLVVQSVVAQHEHVQVGVAMKVGQQGGLLIQDLSVQGSNI